VISNDENSNICLEFGKALIAKCGAVAAVVEDVIDHAPDMDDDIVECIVHIYSCNSLSKADLLPTHTPQPVQPAQRGSKERGVIAVTHAGADLFLRSAYAPDKFKHRAVLLE